VIVVVMGVSGAGKSTVGRGIAERLRARFLEGDDYHPAANVAKMRRGEPLDDADRRPWLERLAAELAAYAARGESVVLACSALRRSYRDVLRSQCPQLRFIYLAGSPALIRDRLLRRSGHYMPATLLDSQFAILEEPDSGEALRIDIAPDSGQVIEAACAALNRNSSR
jgi:gluconokinase